MTSTHFHPGRFPVGSAASRAAARFLAEERLAQKRRADLVLVIHGLSVPEFGPWVQNEGGTFSRRCSIPASMTFEEAERAAGLTPVRTDGDYLRLTID